MQTRATEDSTHVDSLETTKASQLGLDFIHPILPRSERRQLLGLDPRRGLLLPEHILLGALFRDSERG